MRSLKDVLEEELKRRVQLTGRNIVSESGAGYYSVKRVDKYLDSEAVEKWAIEQKLMNSSHYKFDAKSFADELGLLDTIIAAGLTRERVTQYYAARASSPRNKQKLLQGKRET